MRHRRANGDFARYRLIIEPWLSFLGHNRRNDDASAQLARVHKPMICQAFLRNDELSFFAATLSLNGVNYAV